MNWKDLKKLIGKAAPLIGTAIGGPGGAIVGGMISSALGVEDTPDAIAAEIRKNPEALLKLKKLESDERMKFQEFSLRTLEVELSDVQNARQNHQHSKMPAIICCSLTGLVGIGIYLLFFYPIPEANSSTAYLLFGTLLAKWGDSIAYWVGTTRSSANKTAILSKN